MNTVWIAICLVAIIFFSINFISLLQYIERTYLGKRFKGKVSDMAWLIIWMVLATSMVTGYIELFLL